MSGDLPGVLTSDAEYKSTVAKFNHDADKLRGYFKSMQDAIKEIHHNETADPTITPVCTTPLPHGSAILPPFITREEVEEFKREALAELGLDYIPRILAEFQEVD